jgi:hypothetical protein
MHKRSFRILLGAHDRDEIKLAVPEVVLREVPKLFRRKVATARDRIEGEFKKLVELSLEADPPTLPDPDAEQGKFEDHLRAMLAARRVSMPPLPDVELDALFDDSVTERRPFQAAGKGFRDALIWRTVLLLCQDEEVVLISKNWKDFAADKTNQTVLHEHLQEDLERLGLSKDRVRLFKSLEELIEQEMPRAEQLDDAMETLRQEDSAARIDLVAGAESALYRLGLEGSDSVTVIEPSDAVIDEVSVEEATVEDVEILNAYPTDSEGIVSLEAVVHATVNFTFTTDDHGAAWLEAEEQDVDLMIGEETFSQFTTLGQRIAVTYWVDLEVEGLQVGEFEKVEARDESPPEL